MSVVYLNEERYCQVCSHPLGPDDDPRGFHRGPCPQPYAKAPSPEVWDYGRATPPVTKGQTTSVTKPAFVTARACKECRGPIPESTGGRPRAFCSDACRQAAHRKGQA